MRPNPINTTNSALVTYLIVPLAVMYAARSKGEFEKSVGVLRELTLRACPFVGRLRTFCVTIYTGVYASIAQRVCGSVAEWQTQRT